MMLPHRCEGSLLLDGQTPLFVIAGLSRSTVDDLSHVRSFHLMMDDDDYEADDFDDFDEDGLDDLDEFEGDDDEGMEDDDDFDDDFDVYDDDDDF